MKPPKSKWRGGKRGRPRLPGDRTPSGRHIPDRGAESGGTDKGHPTTLAHRQWFAQRWTEFKDAKTGETKSRIIMGDVTLSAYPLGILLNGGSIDRAQHDAGVRYARLYCAIAGRATPPALVMDDDKAGRAPDDDDTRAERRAKDEALLREAAADLGKLGRHVKDHVDNVAVYGRTPRWMLPVRPRAGDVRDADALVAGLEALARAFGYRRGAKVAA